MKKLCQLSYAFRITCWLWIFSAFVFFLPENVTEEFNLQEKCKTMCFIDMVIEKIIICFMLVSIFDGTHCIIK